MGLFWDLLQQTQIHSQSSATSSLDARVALLEAQLQATQARQRQLLQILEQHFGRDLDGDGKVG